MMRTRWRWWGWFQLAWWVTTASSAWITLHGHPLWAWVFWLMLVVGVAVACLHYPITVAKIKIVNAYRATRPGRAPMWLPEPGERRFGWLARNQYGVIDMSKYTRDQWMDTQLKWCKNHMQGPWDITLVPVQGYDGRRWLDDRCRCGHTFNLYRLGAAHQQSMGDTYATGAVTAAAVAYEDLKASRDPSHQSGASAYVGIGGAAMYLQAEDRRDMRWMAKYLYAHPEVAGIWLPWPTMRNKAHPIPIA